jgi:spermidine synthase
LTLQVVWTRLLVQILGPTTYAFSIVVAIFIVGIAGGAAIASRLAGRVNAGVGLASALLLSAALALAAASAVDWSLLTIADIVSRPNYQFGDVLQREIVLVTGLLLPMTLAFGAAFPFAVAMASGREESVTENIGLIYAINTIGAILGSLLSGFLLIPRLGLHGTIRTVAALSVAAAVVILVTHAKTRARALRSPSRWRPSGIDRCCRAAPTSTRRRCADPACKQRSPPASCCRIAKDRRQRLRCAA